MLDDEESSIIPESREDSGSIYFMAAILGWLLSRKERFHTYKISLPSIRTYCLVYNITYIKQSTCTVPTFSYIAYYYYSYQNGNKIRKHFTQTKVQN